ncbi:MAG: isoleucine--tRNA ligase, partial [Firmicutes bacterium]|nr:isoleucine--tRNA ligase [Bacillota bacterium]
DASAPVSIHLCDYPVCDASMIDEDLETCMDEVLRIVVMGRSCRNASAIKNRQPVAEMIVKAPMALDDFYKEIIASELNVKSVRFTEDASEISSYSFLPNNRKVGPRYGKQLGAIRKYLSAVDGNAAMQALRTDGVLRFEAAGVQIELAEDDLVISTGQKEGFVTHEDGQVMVALDTNLTPELIEEGYVYELISKIQTMRKESGFEVTDRIRVSLGGSARLSQVAERNKDMITGKVLAEDILADTPLKFEKEWNVNGEMVLIGVEKV